jgi:hypothetical protein
MIPVACLLVGAGTSSALSLMAGKLSLAPSESGDGRYHVLCVTGAIFGIDGFFLVCRLNRCESLRS